jgi:hypothetical protein
MRILKEVWDREEAIGRMCLIGCGIAACSALWLTWDITSTMVISAIESDRISNAPIIYGMAQIADKDFSELKVGVVSEKIPTGSAILTLSRSHFLNTKVGDQLCVRWQSLPDVDRMNVEVVDSSRCK